MYGAKNQAFEYHTGDAAITATAQAAVVGKTFVKIDPATPAIGENEKVRVVTAAAGERPYGVAGWDAAVNEDLTVFHTRTISVTAAEALAAGDPVAVGADGKAAKAAEGATIVGVCERPTAANEDAPVALSL